MKLRVMTVDDEPEILDLLKLYLETFGCEVIIVHDSTDAAKLLALTKVDGLFVDVNMPGMDGFALTKRVRDSKLNRKVPIIMLTGLDDAITMRKGFEAGVDFFLGKPFNRERIYRLMGATRGPMTREKHRYARVPCHSQVQFLLASGSREWRANSVDVSEGGMLISPAPGMTANQELKVTFRLPNVSRPLTANAVVARLVPPEGAGLMFRGLDQRDEKELQGFVRTSLDD